MDKYLSFKNNNVCEERNEYLIPNSGTNSPWINSNYEIGPDHVIEAISNVAEPRGATTRDVVAWIRANYARRAPFIVVKVKRALNHAIRERKLELIAGRYKIIESKSIPSQQTPIASAKFINYDTNTKRASTCISEMNKNPIKDFMNCYKIPSASRYGLNKIFQNNYKHSRRPRTSHVAVQCVLWRKEEPKEKQDFINKNFDWDSSTISEETKPPR